MQINGAGDTIYNIQETATALKRVEMCAAFFYTVPGPKMLWQFGELGYDFSINFNGRTNPKPIRWNYFQEGNRHRLYKAFRALIKLKTENIAFRSSNYDLDVWGTGKRMWVTDPSMNVTIIGKSNVVGRPLAELFFLEQATVSICHTDTRDLAEHTKDADILVTAAGYPNLINSTHLGRECVLIDVGINRLEDGSIRGDMDFEDLCSSPLCRAITPVPGGIGPMTIAMLMQNTLKAYQNLEGVEGILGKWETFPAKGEGSYR